MPVNVVGNLICFFGYIYSSKKLIWLYVLRLLFLWLQSPSTVILEPKKRKSVTASTFFPSIFHEVMELDPMILVFLMLSFKTAFSLSSFTLIKRLFSSSLLSAIRVALSVRDLGSIPEMGRSPGEGKGYPLQCSGLENSTHCIAHGVTKSQT